MHGIISKQMAYGAEEENMIYLRIRGRLGNQLFMYATARVMQLRCKEPTQILIEDFDNQSLQFENSLKHYDLENVSYISDRSVLCSKFRLQEIILRGLAHFERSMTPMQIRRLELPLQPLFRLAHLFRIQDEYVPIPKRIPKNLVVDGYFQCDRYFNEIRKELVEKFVLRSQLEELQYPNLEKICNRNTICITVRLGQDYLKKKMHNVCTVKYWNDAVSKMVEMVENPLFFVCTDDMELARRLIPALNAYECVEQAPGFEPHITLSAMACAKHFIISNSSFSWWAQYLGNDPGKLVIAPSKWYGIEVPCHIYEDNWILVDV